jgi:serine-type D-Ala-D-Ala carboxypeptidase/endopeptidase
MSIHTALPTRLAMAITMLVVGPLALYAQTNAPPDPEVQRILTDQIENGAAVGLVGARVEGEEVRVAAAGRNAGPGSAEPGATTVFEIGSVAKVLTALLLADMVARGEVALEDPIDRFLPAGVQAPAHNGRRINLQHLATHTSGLPRLPDNMAPADLANPYADYVEDDLYAFLSGHTLQREPGERYEYSNLGAGLLGHLLALRGGAPYEQLVRERVLQPLGMGDTRVQPTPDMAARLAAGHGPGLDPVPGWDFAVLAGAGGWRSTAEDLLRLLRAALAPPEGTLGEALALSFQPLAPTGSPGVEIGLGWHRLELGDRQIVWHNGQTGGYYAFLGFDLDRGAGSIVLSNTSADLDELGLQLIDPATPLR